MEQKDILIIGGSAAGITAAITARRYYSEAKITIIRKEEKVLIPCGIPYIFGTLGSVEENIIADTVLSKNNIDLIIDEVISISKGKKIVETANGETIKYNKMILATGSSPLLPPIPGSHLENVFTIKKDIDHIKKILSKVDESKDVVVIGGGFIGLEFADELNKKKNLKVTVIELLPYCLFLACDDEFCKKVEKTLVDKGVNLLTDRKSKSILGDKKVEAVELENGQRINADLVILCTGIRPNINLALNAGLMVDEKKGIVVDDFMVTSDNNIFAAGDCTQKRCYLSGAPIIMGLASIGSTQARIAGANLFGIRRKMDCAVGIFSTRFGELAIGSAGLTQRAAKDINIDVVTSQVSAADKHPGNLPNARELGVKLIFERDTGLLIGGQVYGGESVGELTNFIGCIIQNKMRADEICTFQIGTHPLLTSSPSAYQIINASQIALTDLRK